MGGNERQGTLGRFLKGGMPELSVSRKPGVQEPKTGSGRTGGKASPTEMAQAGAADVMLH